MAKGERIKTYSADDLRRMQAASEDRTDWAKVDAMSQAEVERLADPQDRRVTRVRITGQGQRTVSALIHRARQHERQVLSRFGLDQAETLKAMLRQMIGPVDAGPDPSGDDDSPVGAGSSVADEGST